MWGWRSGTPGKRGRVRGLRECQPPTFLGPHSVLHVTTGKVLPLSKNEYEALHYGSTFSHDDGYCVTCIHSLLYGSTLSHLDGYCVTCIHSLHYGVWRARWSSSFEGTA